MRAEIAEPDADRAARLVALVGALRRAAPADGPEGPLARAVAEWLRRPGIDVELDWVVPGRPNVVATVGGRGAGPALMLAGHFNAGCHPGPWTRDPLEPWVDGGRLHGGAVSDMLGGLAAMVVAAEDLAEDGGPPGDVVLLLTMAHDVMATGVKHAIAARPELPRLAVWGDPTGLAILTAHAGAARYAVELTGRAAHVTRAEEGRDALAAALDAARALRGLAFTHDPDPRLPQLPRHVVGQLEAGTAPGLVAGGARIAGDVRTLPGMDRATVRADLERAVRAACPPGIDARVEITAWQRPLCGPPPRFLVDALSAAHRQALGSEAAPATGPAGQAYCTAAADLAAAGIATVVYGPGEFRWAPDEWVAVDELVAASRVYAALPAVLAEAPAAALPGALAAAR